MIKVEEELRCKAADIMDDKYQRSTVFNLEAEERVPTFSPNEIEDGNYLGSGGFCTVTDLMEVVINSNSSVRKEEKEESSLFVVVQDRNFIAANCDRDGQCRYAIKRISEGLITKAKGRFVAGVVDLAMEAKYLTIIQHPHIIKLRAISTAHPCSDTFFVVLDRLYDTLSDRMKSWKKSSNRLSGLGSVRDLTGSKKEDHLGMRLIVAYDISSALFYLHRNNIIYRDLKPENIGFDIRDDVKIFDFGLATELQPEDRVPGTNTYKLTRETGSPRYMAPEVALSLPYNQKVDVYSFSLLLWEMCELKPPYKGHDLNSLIESVYKGGERPVFTPKKWSKSLKSATEASWSRDSNKRLEFEDFMKTLRGEIGMAYLEDENILNSLDISHRTDKSIIARSSRTG